MSRLRDRIAAQPLAGRAAAGSWHPWGTEDTPLELPAVVTRYALTAEGSYVTGVEQVIAAPDGRMIPMTGAAGYGAVARAGRR